MRYPHVLPERATLQHALDGMNLARFGDGEIKIARGHDAKSQPWHPGLQRQLLAVLARPGSRCVACIPNIAGPVKSPKEPFWAQYRKDEAVRLYDPRLTYGSSFITRPDSSPTALGDDYWDALERLWRGRHVVAVGGSHKSLKADDLVGAASVEEVDAPRTNAWTRQGELLHRLKDEKRLVIMCIGATATVLAWELAKVGVHALDLGHVGMFLRRRRRGEPLTETEEDRAAL